jgi:hypothetical protein
MIHYEKNQQYKLQEQIFSVHEIHVLEIFKMHD